MRQIAHRPMFYSSGQVWSYRARCGVWSYNTVAAQFESDIKCPKGQRWCRNCGRHTP